MSQSRLNIIDKAFEKLDKTGDGVITVDDLKNVYSVKSNPAYTSGDLTEDQILTMFLANFEDGGTVDGKVRVIPKKCTLVPIIFLSCRLLRKNSSITTQE